jgi:hypothetical protein
MGNLSHQQGGTVGRRGEGGSVESSIDIKGRLERREKEDRAKKWRWIYAGGSLRRRESGGEVMCGALPKMGEAHVTESGNSQVLS